MGIDGATASAAVSVGRLSWPAPVPCDIGKVNVAPLLVAAEPEVERKRQPLAKFLYHDVQPDVEAASYARRNFERGTDTSMMQARRRMQHERKEQLVQMPQNRESFLASLNFRPEETRLPVALDLPEPEAPASIDWSPPVEPKGRPHSTGVVFAKVERCHREMVRREVWRQKFDFIYRQVIEKELREGGPTESHRRPSTCSNSGGGGANSSVHGGAEPSEHGHAARVELQGRPATTAVVVSMPSRLSSPSKSKRAAPGRSASHNTSGTSDVQGFSGQPRRAQAIPATGLLAEEEDDALAAAPVRAGWRRTGFRPSTCSSQRGRIGSDAPSQRRSAHQRLADPSGAGVGTAAAVNSTGSTPLHSKGPAVTQSVLHASCSLPELPTELRDVRDEYYGGDELFLHEDVLYSSNPRLFPLRVGHGKLFPTTSLKSIAAC